MRKTPFAVRPYCDPNRPNLRWQVTGPRIEGKRWRRFFEKKGEAETFLEAKKVEHANFGGRGLAMSQSVRVMAQEAAEALAPFGKTIRDALAFYLPHVKAQSRSIAFSALTEVVLQAKEKDGKSNRYIEDLRSRLGQFSAGFGARLVASFTTREIDDWLRSLQVAGLTRNHFRRALHMAFEFALRGGYTTTNPVTGTAKAKVVSGEIGLLTVDECSRLLVAASKDWNPLNRGNSLLPYVTIGLFCGLRSAELTRLRWEEVDLEQREVLVLGAKAKSSRRRIVPLPENAIEWLRATPKAGLVCPPDLRGKLSAVRHAAKIETWPHNALRHSFASYHLAANEDAAKTALILGHTDSRILFEHYRSLVPKREGAKFWQLRPSPTASAKVVAFAP